MLALAPIGEPHLIAVDDVDVALDSAERREMWEVLFRLAAAGFAVVVSCRELEPGRPARDYRIPDAAAAERVTTAGVEQAGEMDDAQQAHEMDVVGDKA